MAPRKEDSRGAEFSQDEFEALLQEQVRWAVRLALETILQAEVDAFIGALPYERSPARQDQRNGSYTRSLETTVGRIADLSVPRTRRGYRTQLFERYARRRAELDAAMSAMFIGGVSTRGVGAVMEHLTGSAPSPATVSRVFHTLEGEYQTWQARPLAERYQYVFADGTYFTVMYAQEGCKMPILAVVGIGLDGQREVLGFCVGDRENQAAWEELFEDLKRRGVKEVGLLITDGHQAMRNALAAKFPATPRQRCIKHKMENVLGYVPKKQREGVGQELKAIFYQDSRAQAEQAVAAFCAKYERDYPSAVACLQRDLEACLTFYAFPQSHWKAIRTTNVIERLFEEVKRRSHKMGAAFRNEGSCLLLFYAVVRGLKFQRLTMPLPAEMPAPAILHNT
jgi:transposase-like protein